MDIALSITVTLVLTLVNGYFSMSEMALSTARKVLLDHEAERGDEKAATAAAVTEDPGSFLAAIQVAITLVGFFSSAFAATNLSEPLAATFVGLGMSELIATPLAPILITLLVSYVSIVCGELVPKRIAMADAESVAKRVAGPIRAFSVLARPLVWLTAASANALATLLHIASAEDRQNVSEDELRYMVTDVEELTDEEKSMIHDVIDLGDTKAREVMVPRVDMCAVEDGTALRDVLDVMRKTGFSRVPVYHGSVDHVVGIAHIKDLLRPVLDQRAEGDKVSRHMRQATYIPDTKDILPLLTEMQAAREQMVIVVDEYGGTAGVITIEDIVEEVVGEIEDEFDPDNKYLTELSTGEWLVDGRFPIDDAIELGWPIDDSDEYETIAGFVLEQFDRLPRPGDILEVAGYTFVVQTIRRRRISTLRVRAPQATPERDEDAVGAADTSVRGRSEHAD